MTSTYHSYARDIARRPRRRLYLHAWALLPAALLGLLVGVSATATLMGSRQAVVQRATCVLRGQDADGLLQARYAPLSGWCEVSR